MEFYRIADRKRIDFIARWVKAGCSPGAPILDVGCGNGIISRRLAEMGFRVTAIDSSEKTLSTAIEHNSHPNLTYRLVSGNDLPPELSAYAAVICSEVLEHLTDPAILLRVIHASLEDNGLLIVTVPNGRGPRELLVTRPVQGIQQNPVTGKWLAAIKRSMGYSGDTVQSSAEDLRHLQFFTLKKLRNLASATGFRIERTAAANFIEQVFPFSLLFRKSATLQRLDCRMADILPIACTSGFMMLWKKERHEH